jgi:nicotinamidase-related amidase
VRVNHQHEGITVPITQLDPETALIVIDLQKGVVALPSVHPIEGVIANAVTLIDAFRERGLPVVLVNVGGAPAGRTERSAT